MLFVACAHRACYRQISARPCPGARRAILRRKMRVCVTRQTETQSLNRASEPAFGQAILKHGMSRQFVPGRTSRLCSHCFGSPLVPPKFSKQRNRCAARADLVIRTTLPDTSSQDCSRGGCTQAAQRDPIQSPHHGDGTGAILVLLSGPSWRISSGGTGGLTPVGPDFVWFRLNQHCDESKVPGRRAFNRGG